MTPEMRPDPATTDQPPRPDPGSPEAVVAGCLCPVMDNGHGAGYLGMRSVFVMAQGCPLHGLSDSEYGLIGGGEA